MQTMKRQPPPRDFRKDLQMLSMFLGKYWKEISSMIGAMILGYLYQRYFLMGAIVGTILLYLVLRDVHKLWIEKRGIPG